MKTKNPKFIVYGMCKRILHSEADFAETRGIHKPGEKVKDSRLEKTVHLIRGTHGATWGAISFKRVVWDDEKPSAEDWTEMTDLFDGLELGTIVKATFEIIGVGNDINAATSGEEWARECIESRKND